MLSAEKNLPGTTRYRMLRAASCEQKSTFITTFEGRRQVGKSCEEYLNSPSPL